MLRLKIKNKLKRSGLTITKNRINVLSHFIKVNKPLSLQSIRLSLKGLDRVTLFRILSIFEKNKIIHSINLDNSKKLYALCSQECKNDSSEDNHNHNHIHFQCESCDDVSCLPIKEFPKLSVSNYIFNTLNINVSGICINCKN